MPKLDYYLAKKPHKEEVKCGDTGLIVEFENKVFMGLIDVLGHGENAYKIAIISEEFLEKNYRKDLIEILKDLDKHIKGMRGLVAGISLLDINSGVLRYTGVGNITARKFGSSNVRILSRPGIIGYIAPTPREEIIKLYDGDVLVLYTDGVKKHFDLEEYPELLIDNAETIAKQIIQQFGKETDDVACIVLRYKR